MGNLDCVAKIVVRKLIGHFGLEQKSRFANCRSYPLPDLEAEIFVENYEETFYLIFN
jgi:hypothetical protein